MDVDSAIRARRTHKQYGSEPVSEAVVRELVEIARWAPNHKLTNPWRFRLLGPDTRAQIDELVPEAEVMKLRRAPTLVLVTALPSADPVLGEEDVLAAAAATYAVLLGGFCEIGEAALGLGQRKCCLVGYPTDRGDVPHRG